MPSLSCWRTSRSVDSRLVRTLGFALLFLTAILVRADGLLAQVNPGYSPPSQRDGPFDSREADLPRNQEMERKLERARETERQKRIVNETNKLLTLTLRYRQVTAGRETMTDQDRSMLAEIEKLARDIRNRMRGM